MYIYSFWAQATGELESGGGHNDSGGGNNTAKSGGRYVNFIGRAGLGQMVHIANEILMHFRTLRRQSCEVSLSEPVDNDSEGNELALMDMISCEDTMLDAIYASDQRKKLTKYVTELLDPREREIIIMRYGLNNVAPRTQREIAEQCGISRSYVSDRPYCKRSPEGLSHADLRAHRLFSGPYTISKEAFRHRVLGQADNIPRRERPRGK